MYSIQEKVQIVKWYYLGNSARAVSILFAENYQNRPVPSHTTIQRLINRFEATGTLLNNCKCVGNVNPNARNEENENAFSVLAAVTENPSVSLR